MPSLTLAAAAVALGLFMNPVRDAAACTRAVYLGPDRQIVTGRSMDWFSDMQTNLWVFPRGTEWDGMGGKGSNAFRWTSRYGSVVATVYEGGSADGMNEKGLVANMLYLAESRYPPEAGDNRPTLSIAGWVQYVLDSFATVEEAVAQLRKEEFRIVSVDAPTGEKGTVHLSISDASGDSAILQYIDGKLVIYHDRQHQVMTNSPTFDQQLALNAYWRQIGGTIMLPGTNRAADRFVRASFYINAAEQTSDARKAVAAVLSVMRNVSVPRGITTPDQPNISSTLWRTVADQKNLVYYFESTLSPSLVWVRLDRIDFSPGSGARRLTLDGNPDLAGDQSRGFVSAQRFVFLAPH
jgi:choloylglycine hydrolase